MSSLPYLILGDHEAYLYEKGKDPVLLKSPDEFPWLKPKAINVFINSCDLEITCTKVPTLSLLDRLLFAHQRARYHNKKGLYGQKYFQDQLIEFSCPRSGLIEEWLNALKIKRLSPLLIPPPSILKTGLALVLTDHSSMGIRHSVYRDSTPIFTRLSQQNFVQDIQTTLSYIKNKHSNQQINIYAYVRPSLGEKLLQFEGEEVQIYSTETLSNIISENTSLAFKFKKQRLPQILKYPLIAAIPACLLLAYWQYEDLNAQQINHIPPANTPVITTVRLEAILYLDPDNWCAWINGQKITPENCPSHILVKNITNDNIDLIWKTASTEHRLNLKVNETSQISEN